MKIFKYRVPIVQEFSIDMPNGANVIAYQVQHGDPTIWAEVDETKALVKHNFITLGTGHEAPELRGRHLGTIQLDSFVWHLYEGVPDNYRG